MITKDPTQVEAKDEGKWTCNVGVVVNSEVGKNSKITNKVSIRISKISISIKREQNQPE